MFLAAREKSNEVTVAGKLSGVFASIMTKLPWMNTEKTSLNVLAPLMETPAKKNVVVADTARKAIHARTPRSSFCKVDSRIVVIALLLRFRCIEKKNNLESGG